MFSPVQPHTTESIILRPNTLLEFASLRCRGRYERNEYSALTKLCLDCYNVYRHPSLYGKCT